MPRTPIHAVVESTQRLTPHMVRVVLGGDDLASFTPLEFTDQYVKLKLAGRTRTYTVREWDAAAGRMTIDFVVHGDTGVAGPWALAAGPGDPIELAGPGGAYAPDPAADWHLLAGDEAVLPAIAAALQRIPEDVPVLVVVEVAGAGEEVPLSSPGDLRLRWLHRDAGHPGLVEAVAALEFPAGAVCGFVHGEAGVVRELRRHLLADRGVPRDALSISGYWKRRLDDEAWRALKPKWNAAVEADVPAVYDSTSAS